MERLSVLMNMSKPTLYRKIKSISDLSPHDIINLTRLKKAADLINSGNHRVNELAEEAGYNSPGQFRRNFYKYFKMSPSEYIEKAHTHLSKIAVVSIAPALMGFSVSNVQPGKGERKSIQSFMYTVFQAAFMQQCNGFGQRQS